MIPTPRNGMPKMTEPHPGIVFEHVDHRVCAVGKGNAGKATEGVVSQSIDAFPGPRFHLQRANTDPAQIGIVIQQLQLVFLIGVPVLEKHLGIPAHKAGAESHYILRPKITAATAPHQPWYLLSTHLSQYMPGDIGAQVGW